MHKIKIFNKILDLNMRIFNFLYYHLIQKIDKNSKKTKFHFINNLHNYKN